MRHANFSAIHSNRIPTLSLIGKYIADLAGRHVALLKLLPLSLRELKKEKHELKSVEDLIFTGFYPKLYTNNITPSIQINLFRKEM